MLPDIVLNETDFIKTDGPAGPDALDRSIAIGKVKHKMPFDPFNPVLIIGRLKRAIGDIVGIVRLVDEHSVPACDGVDPARDRDIGAGNIKARAIRDIRKQRRAV